MASRTSALGCRLEALRREPSIRSRLGWSLAMQRAQKAFGRRLLETAAIRV
jgi:hypothetical protein